MDWRVSPFRASKGDGCMVTLAYYLLLMVISHSSSIDSLDSDFDFIVESEIGNFDIKFELRENLMGFSYTIMYLCL